MEKENKPKETKTVKNKEGLKVKAVYFALHIDIMPLQIRSVLSMQADEKTEMTLKENYLLIVKNKVQIVVPLSNIRCLTLE